MPQVDLFQIGSSGTRAYQAAMGAVADNIANTNTAGYSRRNLEIKESSASASSSIFEKGGASFAGVDIGACSAPATPISMRPTRRTANTLGSADQRARWMTDIQTALDDGPLGVGQRLAACFRPSSVSPPTLDGTLRTDVLFSMEQVNTAFRLAHGGLKDLQDGISTTATNEVARSTTRSSSSPRPSKACAARSTVPPAQVQLFDLTRSGSAGDFQAHQRDLDLRRQGHCQCRLQRLACRQQYRSASVRRKRQYRTAHAGLHAGRTAVTAPTSGALAGLAQSADVAKTRVDRIEHARPELCDGRQHLAYGRFYAGRHCGQPMLLDRRRCFDPAGADYRSLEEIASVDAGGMINGNLVAASAIRGPGSMEDSWTQMISAQGNIAQCDDCRTESGSRSRHRSPSKRAATFPGSISIARRPTCCVSSRLIRAARIIQVAREITQSIFDVMG